MIKGIRPRLAEAGKIKTGGLGETRTAESGREYRLPISYDHFVITRNDRDSAGDLVLDRVLMDAIGKLQSDSTSRVEMGVKIREIPIVLHSDELEEVFPTSYACYLGKKLHCRGDGEKATRWEIKDGHKTGVVTGIKCTCPYLGATGGPICKPHGILHCSIAVKGHALARDVLLSAETCRVATVVKDRGHAVSYLSCRLRNAGEQFFRMTLPEGAELWGTYVQGRAVRPNRLPEGDILVPIIEQSYGDAFDLGVIWSEPAEEMGLGSGDAARELNEKTQEEYGERAED